MEFKQDWDKTEARFREYWARENHDRPLLGLAGRREKRVQSTVKRPEEIRERWLDTQYVIENSIANMKNTFYGAESYPVINPNLGPDIFGATFGCDLVFEETTSYAKPIVEDWASFPKLEFNENNPWWQKIRSMTEEIAQYGNGKYLTGVTDIHAGADGLVSLRGPQNLCTDLFDCPEQIKPRTFELFESFKIQFDALCCAIEKHQQGSVNWMGLWHPERWYVTSCDFCCMISPDMFEDYIVEEIIAEAKYLNGNTIFHLDGIGALKHLDRLLAIPEIAGIQWVYGAGQPSAAHWISVLKRIQAAGKCIHILAEPEDLPVLLEEVEPEGVFYSMQGAFAEEEVKTIIEQVEKSRRRKAF